MPDRIHHRPEGHWNWPIPLPYRPGLRVGNLVFVGGEAALDEEGRVLFPNDVIRQTRLVMENIGRVLEGLGASYADVVKVVAFYVGEGTREVWEESARVRAEYFPDPGPVATSVPLPALAYPGLMIEVEVVAVCD